MTDEATASESGQAADDVQDSLTFSRCAACRHAENVDRSAGSFVCRKHNMRCDAESDAIPDDCPQYEPADPQADAES